MKADYLLLLKIEHPSDWSARIDDYLFDYTLWQKNLWDKEDVEELSKNAMKYPEENK